MRPVGLIVTREDTLADHLVQELRTLGWIAVPIDSADVALEMMEAVTISLVMVDVANGADWLACRRLAEPGQSRVAIVTSFLARDRRYRHRAFEGGSRRTCVSRVREADFVRCFGGCRTGNSASSSWLAPCRACRTDQSPA